MAGSSSRANGKKGGRPKGSRDKHSKRAEAERAALERAGIRAEEVQQQVRRGGWFDLRDLFDKQGNLKPIHQLSYDEQFQIAGLEILKRNVTAGDGHTDTVLKVRWIDRARYIEMAANRVWPETKQMDVTLKVSLEDLVAGSRE